MHKALNAWGACDFDAVFKAEAQRLGVDQLPLQQGLTGSSYALDQTLSVMIIRTWEVDDRVVVKAGVFYQGVIAGCSCADDPGTVEENSEFCVLQFDIDKRSAETSITLLDE